eukprot:m.860229 g.860229  ORF g.860229 m.860229 type:complete len:55 (+) comp23527_c0_seq17:969-1133(+)
MNCPSCKKIVHAHAAYEKEVNSLLTRSDLLSPTALNGASNTVRMCLMFPVHVST